MVRGALLRGASGLSERGRRRRRRLPCWNELSDMGSGFLCSVGLGAPRSGACLGRVAGMDCGSHPWRRAVSRTALAVHRSPVGCRTVQKWIHRIRCVGDRIPSRRGAHASSSLVHLKLLAQSGGWRGAFRNSVGGQETSEHSTLDSSRED